MSKPTAEQIQEVFLWCGFEEIQYCNFKGPMPGCIHWAHPDAVGGGCSTLPKVDLNNLFKYAEPLLDKLGEHYIVLQKQWNNLSIKQATLAFVDIAKFPAEFEGEGETEAIALFWAFYKVMKETRNSIRVLLTEKDENSGS